MKHLNNYFWAFKANCKLGEWVKERLVGEGTGGVERNVFQLVCLLTQRSQECWNWVNSGIREVGSVQEGPSTPLLVYFPWCPCFPKIRFIESLPHCRTSLWSFFTETTFDGKFGDGELNWWIMFLESIYSVYPGSTALRSLAYNPTISPLLSRSRWYLTGVNAFFLAP